MPELPTRLDLYGVGRQYVVAHARRIEPTMVDVDGSDANLFVGSQSFMGHAVVRQLGERVCALLLDGCDGMDPNGPTPESAGWKRSAAVRTVVMWASRLDQE